MKLLAKIFLALELRCHSIYGKFKLFVFKNRYNDINWKGIKVAGNIFMRLEGKVIFGNNIRFNNHTIFNFCGLKAASSIAVKRNGILSIGNNTGFSGTAIYCANQIIIGNDCNFGANTCIWDTDFHPLDTEERRSNNANKIKTAPIIIGNDVFVGANSLILKGVTIGDGVIIGAGSVVTHNLEPYCVYAGNPAKKIR